MSPGSVEARQAQRVPAVRFRAQHGGTCPGTLAAASTIASHSVGPSRSPRDLHIGGSRPRPSEQEILDALTHGSRKPIDGQNAVQYVLGRVKVIVNRDMPWQSTGYYRGG